MKASEKSKTEYSQIVAPAGRGKADATHRSHSRSTNVRPWRKLHLNNILVPTDFSTPSKKALTYAVSFAKRVGSKITLIHVVEPLPACSDIVDQVISGPEFWLTGAQKAFRKLCSENHIAPSMVRHILIRNGTPHHEITEAARELEADLIIIATSGRSGLAHVLVGSTTERVIRYAPCPVLVVRRKERELIDR